MSYRKTRSWDNRDAFRKRGQLVQVGPNGRHWTRRIQWLEDEHGSVKLKFEDGPLYFETGVPPAFAQTVWDRFKNGDSIGDSVSIFGCRAQPSRRASQGEQMC